MAKSCAAVCLSALAAQARRDRRLAERPDHLNPVYPPDPSLWTQARCDRINADAARRFDMLRADLAADFLLPDDHDPLAEDPGLGARLAAHPGLGQVAQTGPRLRPKSCNLLCRNATN
ncbi:hypothetical protein LHP98_17155 [Rhodobacter sp. Har01]|uniref:hypothetical protein n=1 Tax=Rhodobacter sp. Har01 TaxID=2883999 RepID=UPI001D08A1AC|nr:hypothetical protein [Rhodobacter sp. Har01]MCB6179852.1 hypothetical protein [Rhodobacter sp. Har01]